MVVHTRVTSIGQVNLKIVCIKNVYLKIKVFIKVWFGFFVLMAYQPREVI